MSRKERLEGKITSEEQFQQILSESGYVSSAVYPRLVTPETQHKERYDHIIMPVPWWLKREYLRIHDKVYPEPTEVIKYLNQARPEFALHVSKEDAQYIAYTPDRQSGESDRQLRTTLGRYLGKIWPHLPESSVQAMVTDHMAELSDEFELLYGQDVVNVYKNIEGPSSCMSKSEWDGAAQHPAEVYDAEGIGMAVLRDATGRIVTRALVYHASETDKRYIRTYTDAKLTKRLLRAGYKQGTWHGAKFRTILSNSQVSAYKTTYVFPYLDGNGGAGSAAVSTVACIDGVITGVTADAATKMNDHFGKVVTGVALNTSGKLDLVPVLSESFTRTCALTGATLNIITDSVKTYWDGFQLLDIAESAVISHDLTAARYAGNTKVVYTRPDVPRFTHRTSIYVDNYVNRDYCGFRKLSAKYYGESNEWFQLTSDFEKLADGTLIRKEDAITVIDREESGGVLIRCIRHKSELDYTWTKVHAETKGQLMYAADGVEVVKTLSGRKVVSGVHSVSQLWDGTYEFTRNTVSRFCYDRYIVSSKKNPVDINAGGAIWNMVVEEAFAGGQVREDILIHLAAEIASYVTTRTFNTLHTRHQAWDSLTNPGSVNYIESLATNEHLAPLIYRVNVMQAEQLALDYSISTDLQGAAGSTWTPPPEVPNGYGRTGYLARLYEHLLAAPLQATAPIVHLVISHGWNGSDLTDSHKLRQALREFKESSSYVQAIWSSTETSEVLNEAYLDRLAYNRYLIKFIGEHANEITVENGLIVFNAATRPAWEQCLEDAEETLWSKVVGSGDPLPVSVTEPVTVQEVLATEYSAVQPATQTTASTLYTSTSTATRVTIAGTYMPMTASTTPF